MLKVTFPNGVIVEGDVVQEVTELVAAAMNRQPVNGHVKAQSATKVPEPRSPEPEISETEISEQTFPHKYAPNGKRAVCIGEREDQVLQMSKLIAEEAGDRTHQFKTSEVFELIDNAPSIHSIGSAFQSLKGKGLVRHAADNRKRWIITERGWNTCYRVTQPMVPVVPTI